MSQAIAKLASRTVRGRSEKPMKPPESNAIVARSPASIEPDRRREWTAVAAYFRAERRGFEEGYELEDWCAAEQELDRLLARGELPG